MLKIHVMMGRSKLGLFFHPSSQLGLIVDFGMSLGLGQGMLPRRTGHRREWEAESAQEVNRTPTWTLREDIYFITECLCKVIQETLKVSKFRQREFISLIKRKKFFIFLKVLRSK